jgi:hypothetical protein
LQIFFQILPSAFVIHTMRLFLNVLAPLFLLKSFTSATDYNFSMTWVAVDAVGTCTADMADAVSDAVTVNANIYLAGLYLPQVAYWDLGTRHGAVGRQLRVRALCGSACPYSMCSIGTTCYDSYNCNMCRREERQLYHVERALDAAEIVTLQNGLVGACQEALNEEESRSGDFYSTSCKAALVLQLCEAIVTEVV